MLCSVTSCQLYFWICMQLRSRESSRVRCQKRKQNLENLEKGPGAPLSTTLQRKVWLERHTQSSAQYYLAGLSFAAKDLTRVCEGPVHMYATLEMSRRPSDVTKVSTTDITQFPPPMEFLMSNLFTLTAPAGSATNTDVAFYILSRANVH